MMHVRSYSHAANLIAQKEKDIDNLQARFNISIQIQSVTALLLLAYKYLDEGRRKEKRFLVDEAQMAFQKAHEYIRYYEVAVYRNVAKQNLKYARGRIEQAGRYDNIHLSIDLYNSAIREFKEGRKAEAKGIHEVCIHAYYRAAETADAASEQIRGSRFSDEGMKYFFMLIMLLFPILLLLAVLQ